MASSPMKEGVHDDTNETSVEHDCCSPTKRLFHASRYNSFELELQLFN